MDKFAKIFEINGHQILVEKEEKNGIQVIKFKAMRGSDKVVGTQDDFCGMPRDVAFDLINETVCVEAFKGVLDL